MIRKAVIAALLVPIALLAAPLAASAVGYVPEGNVTVSGSTEPGGTATVTFSDGSFLGGESVSGSATGDPTPTLGILKTGTVTTTKSATAGGGVSFTVGLPTNATGTYTLTAVGEESGNVGTASITVTPADSGSGSDTGLPNTGSSVPMLAVWIGAGLVALGAGLVSVFVVRRRKHQHS